MNRKLTMMFAALVVAFGARAETETVGGYTWKYRINGDTAEIYGTDNYPYLAISPKPSGTVTIPSTLGGKPVTSIGEYAFYNCIGLTSVTIPDSVTSIGKCAFWRCIGLTSVTIPDSVTSIGNLAFYGCSGLTSVHITDIAKWCGISFGSNSDNPLYYAHDLYLNGEKVTDLVIPDSVTSIGEHAFEYCSGLTSVTIPDSVRSIGEDAFLGCSGLTSVMIPDSVTSIGDSAFYGCSGLTSVTIGNGVTSIGHLAFYECGGLTSVIIPDSVTSIGDEAFYNCTSLERLAIPEGVKSYGANCFEGCPAYTLNLYRAVFGGGVGGGSASVVTTVVQQVAAPYSLTNAVADRAIASVTVDADCAIDGFVLKNGEVYDCVLRIVNTANRDVKVTLPSGYEYETFEGVDPLTIPASSRNLLTITRTADKTFLVSREKLQAIR